MQVTLCVIRTNVQTAARSEQAVAKTASEQTQQAQRCSVIHRMHVDLYSILSADSCACHGHCGQIYGIPCEAMF